MSSSRISGITFLMLVTSLLFVNGHGMKSTSSEVPIKKNNIKEGAYNVALSSRDKTQINSNENQKVDNDNVYTTTNPSHKDECEVKINRRSKAVFQQILKHRNPHFVQFRIIFSKSVNSTKDVFQPGRWYWTYGKFNRPYQFLSWYLYYGIVSFGLLDYRTSFVPFVDLDINGSCNLTLGTKDTSKLITTALVSAVNITSAPDLPHKYKENYFCYLSVREDLRNTFRYHAAIYLLYPVIFVNYKCCLLKYNFTDETFENNCSQQASQKIKGTHVLSLNILLGLLIIAYCPVLLFKLFAWLGESDKTDNDEHGVELIQDISGHDDDNGNDEWIFANGKSPLTFFDVISFKGIGVDKRWPVLVSRLRRFLCLLLAPSVIYIELLMFSRGIGVWEQGDKITIKDFVDVGTPFGFLSFLGDPRNRNKVFVPAFGGPVGISALYFVLGFFYIVLPKCLKQVIENGLPNSDVLIEEERRPSRIVIKSPLFFGAKDIIKLAQIYVNHADLEPGYSKGVTLMKCNFHMLFTIQFWRQVYHIQTGRLSSCTERMSFLMCLLSVFYMPIYIVICLCEVLLCILYFGVPFIFFMVVMVRGAMKMIPNLRENNTFFFYLFSVRFTRACGVVSLLVTILLFAYCIFLLYVDSFKFVSHVMTYCFVAVIIYPSVSFGALFLLVVIVYYIIRQLKHFCYSYTRLLSIAVEVSKHIGVTPKHATCFKGHLIISNVGFENIREIEINGQLLDVSQNVLMNRNTETAVKVKLVDNSYGIPKDLFNSLIQKYRPVHTHVLSLLLRVFILIGCVALFYSITHNYIVVPEDKISQVMHVVFIIAVGALPKLIETNFIRHNNASVEKIEKRYIEQSIVAYWTQRDRSTVNEPN